METFSEEYQKQLQVMHAEGVWGKPNVGFMPYIRAFAKILGAKSCLDYGAGHGQLKKYIEAQEIFSKVYEYDPGVPGLEVPKRADMIICFDVLEHIEPHCVLPAIAHIKSLCNIGAFMNISLVPSRETLPDGRNAHLTVKPYEFWLSHLRAHWPYLMWEDKGKAVRVWLRK